MAAICGVENELGLGVYLIKKERKVNSTRSTGSKEWINEIEVDKNLDSIQN